MDVSKLFEKEDSLISMIGTLSPTFFTYYMSLKQLGFTHQQALELAKDCKQGLTKLKGES